MKRALFAVSELALWVLLFVMLFGCEAKPISPATKIAATADAEGRVVIAAVPAEIEIAVQSK